MAGIDERLLAKLGEEGLGNHPDVPKLARELGFKQTKINLYIQTNHVCGQVGTKGTVNLLFDWKKSKRKAEQVPTLRAALIQAGFSDLAEEYFPDHSGNPAPSSTPVSTSSAYAPNPPSTSTVTPSHPLPDLASPSSTAPNPNPAPVTGQVVNPVVQPASNQPSQPGRNLGYQPRPSPESNSMATVTGRQIIFLSQNVLPTCYNSLCTHLSFDFAIYDGVKSKHLNDIPGALVEILNKWAADKGGLLWDLDQALMASGCAGLVDRYKDPPQL